MEEWANAWTKHYTAGSGNYMVAAMEDSGMLGTVSNYDRELPGTRAADSLKGMVFENYWAYLPALEGAQTVTGRVARDIFEHWNPVATNPEKNRRHRQEFLC